jgi:hypothetical protein
MTACDLGRRGYREFGAPSTRPPDRRIIWPVQWIELTVRRRDPKESYPRPILNLSFYVLHLDVKTVMLTRADRLAGP